jgi:hypothetical protein
MRGALKYNSHIVGIYSTSTIFSKIVSVVGRAMLLQGRPHTIYRRAEGMAKQPSLAVTSHHQRRPTQRLYSRGYLRS